MAEGEHINFISLEYTSSGFTSLSVRTTSGNLILADGNNDSDSEDSEWESDADLQKKRIEFNLQDEGKAVVGFETRFNDCLESLCVFAASIIEPVGNNFKETEKQN